MKLLLRDYFSDKLSIAHGRLQDVIISFKSFPLCQRDTDSSIGLY